MKRKIISLLCTVIAVFTVCSVFLTGCFGGSSSGDNSYKEYTIQYTDDKGVHQIYVADGMPYSLEKLPSKKGYTFLGLFDAEVGGTQYVSSSGSSLSPFTDGKNLVLFPQFQVNSYKLFLDYQGAQVTGDREYSVNYGERLPELPKYVNLEHYNFVGWFTKQGNKGVQVADQYGLLSSASYVNETNFDLSGEFIYLYAGFEIEKFTVTFCYEPNMPTEDVEVVYNTPLSEIVSETRVNGKAVLSWSKNRGGEEFNGKITGDTVLYAKEYAPVIDFDSDGGSKVNSLIATAGSAISLPVPEKELSKFSHWEDTQGNRYENATMPENSISLKAVWQAKLVFDENGGSDVEDISVNVGEKITLPEPERDGYVFAGWYTDNEKQYTATIMPSTGIALKAGWYKEKEALIIQCSGDKSLDYYNTTTTLKNGLTLDLSEYLPDNYNGTVKLNAQFKARHTLASLAEQKWIILYFYSTGTISESYKLWEQKFTITSSSYENFSYSLTTKLSGNKLYGAVKVSQYGGNSSISDYRISFSYLDTKNLYI